MFQYDTTQRVAEDIIRNTWRRLIVGQTVLVLSLAVLPNLVLSGRPQLGKDATVFLYSGWLWAETSGVPYLHVWDVKPPAIHETTALVSLVTDGNPFGMVILAVGMMSCAVLLTTRLCGELVYYHTQNPVASYLAGTVPLTLRVYYMLAGVGIRPKHFVMAFGLLSIYLALVANRWTLAGASAGLAAAYWQFGIIFPVLVAGLSAVRSRKTLREVITGGATVAVIVVAPIYLSSPVAFQAMLAEVIGTAIWITEDLVLTERIDTLLGYLSISMPVIAIGIAGSVLGRSKGNTWWVPAGVTFALGQVVWLDLDGPPDLIMLVILSGVGFGLLVDRTDEYTVPLYLVTGVAAVQIALAAAGLTLPTEEALVDGSLQQLFWEQKVTDRCHIRLSPTEKRFIKLLGADETQRQCAYQLRDLLRS